MRKLVAAAMLLAAASMTAAAQEQEQQRPNNELAVTVGRTFISDQGVPGTNFFDNVVHSGKGLTFGVDYARRVRDFRWGTLSAALPGSYNPDEDLNYGINQVPKQYSTLFITPAARLGFMEDLAFNPWVDFGGGLGRFVASKDLVFFGSNPGHRVKNSFALTGGIGFDVRMPALFQGIKFRFEARDNWSTEPPINVNTGKTHRHNFYVAGGAVFHF